MVGGEEGHTPCIPARLLPLEEEHTYGKHQYLILYADTE